MVPTHPDPGAPAEVLDPAASDGESQLDDTPDLYRYARSTSRGPAAAATHRPVVQWEQGGHGSLPPSGRLAFGLDAWADAARRRAVSSMQRSTSEVHPVWSRAHATAVVAVEVFVEQNQVLPMWIAGVALLALPLRTRTAETPATGDWLQVGAGPDAAGGYTRHPVRLAPPGARPTILRSAKRTPLRFSSRRGLGSYRRTVRGSPVADVAQGERT